jgi:ABC-type dipeptide/oligopeptide/nickel transport system permease subunit
MALTGRLSAAVLFMVIIASLFSPLLAPYDPDAIDLDSIKEPPSSRHIMGTDNKGRDIFSRILHGGRISVFVSLTAAFVCMTIGLGVGLVSGYIGGKTDIFLMAVVDLILSFPSFLLAIGISVILSPGVYTVIIAISAVGWASFARVIRGNVFMLRESLFVEAARALGCSRARILLMHILPQCIPLTLVMAGLKTGGFILTEAGLSFLGLGSQPPSATWGSMISSSRIFISSAPWTVLFPGIMISVTAICFNLLGDSLRDKLDSSGTSLSH